MGKLKPKTESRITVSSTAEYFAKNLQQVGFSSPTKAVLTTLKEAMDNSLDACEEHGILPDIKVVVQKKGRGSLKNTDQIMIRVEDNGPGIQFRDLPKVFGEYLASSKFGKGRCSRGQQGIGISAATTWAMQTTATGVFVISKTKSQKKAISARIDVDLKSNKGLLKEKQEITWDRPHGTLVEFLIDGRVQLNGESGLLTFLRSNVLVNPHMTLTYQLMDDPEVVEERVSNIVPRIPEATAPHPHTMKLGEFLAHARLFGDLKTTDWLHKGFSRIGEGVLRELKEKGISSSILSKNLKALVEADFKKLFVTLQECDLKAPSTQSVLSIGEEGLAKSILRLGDVDYFSVVTRKPMICDFKPVQIEVAIARFTERSGLDSDSTVQVLRFANRVPLQFDKAGCAIVKGITSVNWKAYGLRQAKGAIPLGPYIIAVSLVSPFIKFKNASKETVDASDELVEELRRGLMQAGQRLSRHLRREHKEAALENKIQHIEQFAPILVEGLVRITGAGEDRKDKAHFGLLKILGRETKVAEKELEVAETQLKQHLRRKIKRLGNDMSYLAGENEGEEDIIQAEEVLEELMEQDNQGKSPKTSKKAKSKKIKKTSDSNKVKSAIKKSAKTEKTKPTKKSTKSVKKKSNSTGKKKSVKTEKTKPTKKSTKSVKKKFVSNQKKKRSQSKPALAKSKKTGKKTSVKRKIVKKAKTKVAKKLKKKKSR